MKTVTFLGSKQHGEKNDIASMAQQVQQRLGSDVQSRSVYFEDLQFHISNAGRKIVDVATGADLAATDLLVAVNWYTARDHLRDIAFTVGLYVAEKEVPFWNQEMAQQRSTTKLSAMWQLSQAGVPIPETVFSLSHDALAWQGQPVIVKAIAGSRGRDNYLAKTEAEFCAILGHEGAYMVQEYIPNDYDLRLVCFDGQPQLVIKRQRADQTTHLNNTSQGAEASVVELETVPTAVREQARAICKLFGRNIAGIDYLVANDGTNRYICLEVNAIPQLTSGTFTDQKYDHLSRSIRAALDRKEAV